MSVEEIIKFACKGNEDAKRFCESWYQFCQALDDLVDRDNSVSADAAASALVSWTLAVASNPFFRGNAIYLLGLIRQAANMWVESNHRKGHERDILKGYWQNVIFAVADLTGGWAAMRELTSKALEFQYEDAAVSGGRFHSFPETM